MNPPRVPRHLLEITNRFGATRHAVSRESSQSTEKFNLYAFPRLGKRSRTEGCTLQRCGCESWRVYRLTPPDSWKHAFPRTLYERRSSITNDVIEFAAYVGGRWCRGVTSSRRKEDSFLDACLCSRDARHVTGVWDLGDLCRVQTCSKVSGTGKV